MIQILRVYAKIAPPGPDVALVFVPAEGFAHVEGVFAFAVAGRVVAVVVDDAAEDGVAGFVVLAFSSVRFS